MSSTISPTDFKVAMVDLFLQIVTYPSVMDYQKKINKLKTWFMHWLLIGGRSEWEFAVDCKKGAGLKRKKSVVSLEEQIM